MTLCVIMTGCLQGGPLFPQQLAAAFSLPVGLRGFSSLSPPPHLSVLCSVCLYQYRFVSSSGLTSICLPHFPVSSCPHQQRETEGEGFIPPTTRNSPSISLPGFLLHPQLQHDAAGLREVASHPEQVPLR